LLNVAPALFKLPNGKNDYAIAPGVPAPRVFNKEVSPFAPEQTWLRGFRFSLIGDVSSHQYYTLYAGSDVNHDGNVLSDRVDLLGRNTYRGDGLVNFDIRLSRVFRLSERARLEAIAEAFNLFNNLNVTDINTVYGAPDFIGPEPQRFHDRALAPSPDFGAIRATAPPRQIQLALRAVF
jgi:hypothetical protein